MPLVELRYLDVRWKASGTAKSVTVAPRSIPIEIELDGTMRAETEIFHDLYPVLGMRLDDALAEHTPVAIKFKQYENGEGSTSVPFPPPLAIYFFEKFGKPPNLLTLGHSFSAGALHRCILQALVLPALF